MQWNLHKSLTYAVKESLKKVVRGDKCESPICLWLNQQLFRLPPLMVMIGYFFQKHWAAGEVLAIHTVGRLIYAIRLCSFFLHGLRGKYAVKEIQVMAFFVSQVIYEVRCCHGSVSGCTVSTRKAACGECLSCDSISRNRHQCWVIFKGKQRWICKTMMRF